MGQKQATTPGASDIPAPLRPKYPIWPIRIIEAIFIAPSTLTIWFIVSGRGFPWSQEFPIALFLLLLTAGAIFVMELESKKVMSLELNHDGIRTLAWIRKPFPRMLRLEPIFVSWKNIYRVRDGRDTIYLDDDGEHRVALHLKYFNESDVIRLINKQWAKENSDN